MNDDSTQRDEEHRAAPKNEERQETPAAMLPWLDAAPEELFGAAPERA
jgi:hypothetical protein